MHITLAVRDVAVDLAGVRGDIVGVEIEPFVHAFAQRAYSGPGLYGKAMLVDAVLRDRRG